MTDDASGSPRATARDLLRTQSTCTLATASAAGVPEAATVRFVAGDGLDVSVTTQSTARKYENLAENPTVAVVVDGDGLNLQLEGTATEVTDERAADIERRYVEKYGQSRYLTNDRSVFFEIATDWARLLVDGSYPPTYETITTS